MKTARRLFAALGLVTVLVTVAVVGITGLPASNAAPAVEIHKVDDAAFDPTPTDPKAPLDVPQPIQIRADVVAVLAVVAEVQNTMTQSG